MSMTTSPASTLPDTPGYLNGEFSTLKDAEITVLDVQPIGHQGKPGPIHTKLYAACQQAKQEQST